MSVKNDTHQRRRDGGPYPCAGCEFVTVCRTGKSCRAFARYYHGSEWRGIPRVPSPRRYQHMMRDG